jgi:hypothetical protein
MDKLQVAFDIVLKKAMEQRQAGEVPSFLGIRGMLALMYDRIRAFAKEPEDMSEPVLDLAIKAMFAVAECLPDPHEGIGHLDEPEENHEEEVVDDEEKAMPRVGPPPENDKRWTPVPPNAPLPSVDNDDELLDEDA